MQPTNSSAILADVKRRKAARRAADDESRLILVELVRFRNRRRKARA